MAKVDSVKRTADDTATGFVRRRVKVETLTGLFDGSHRFCSPGCEEIVLNGYCTAFHVDLKGHEAANEYVRCSACRRAFGDMKPTKSEGEQAQ